MVLYSILSGLLERCLVNVFLHWEKFNSQQITGEKYSVQFSLCGMFFFILIRGKNNKLLCGYILGEASDKF